MKLRTSFLVPGLFFSAVLFPSLLFCGLYLYPFLDKLISGDLTDRQYNVLLLPYEQPFNTAQGCATLMFLLVLFFAGSDDVIAVAVGSSVIAIRTILRVLSLALPPVTFVLVFLLCRMITAPPAHCTPCARRNNRERFSRSGPAFAIGEHERANGTHTPSIGQQLHQNDSFG